MSMFKRIAGFLFAAAILGFGAGARAQSKPCMADAARICPEVAPGGGAQIQCLKEHKEELSPGCKKKVMQMKIEQMEQKQLQEQQQAPQP
jgi:Cysteine rich repeat